MIFGLLIDANTRVFFSKWRGFWIFRFFFISLNEFISHVHRFAVIGSVVPTNCVDKIGFRGSSRTFKSISSNTLLQQANENKKKRHRYSGRNLNGCKTQYYTPPVMVWMGLSFNSIWLILFGLYVRNFKENENRKMCNIMPSSHWPRCCALIVNKLPISLISDCSRIDRSISA